MKKPGPAVCGRGTHEQAGADRAADGDHLKLSWFEAFVIALILVSQRRRVVFDSGSHWCDVKCGGREPKLGAVKVELRKDLAGVTAMPG